MAAAAAAAATILNARGARFEQQRAAVHIDQGVTLAAIDLLARIISHMDHRFRRPDGPTVDDRRRGAPRAADALTIHFKTTPSAAVNCPPYVDRPRRS